MLEVGAILAIVFSLIAIILSLRGASRPTAAAPPSDSAGHERRALEARLDRIERWLKLIADKRPVSSEMIEEGRVWAEIDADAARRAIEVDRPAGLVVLDVRTEPEVRGGHVPHAKWIPVDQIEERAREVPRNGTVLVFCAAGARSAAACEFLSQRGHANVVNVAGGMSAWKGEVAKGLPA